MGGVLWKGGEYILEIASDSLSLALSHAHAHAPTRTRTRTHVGLPTGTHAKETLGFHLQTLSKQKQYSMTDAGCCNILYIVRYPVQTRRGASGSGQGLGASNDRQTSCRCYPPESSSPPATTSTRWCFFFPRTLFLVSKSVGHTVTVAAQQCTAGSAVRRRHAHIIKAHKLTVKPRIASNDLSRSFFFFAGPTIKPSIGFS